MNKLFYILFTALFCSCVQNNHTEILQKERDVIIDVQKEVKEINFDDVLIGNISRMYMIDNYLIICDYKSTDELIHIFDSKSFRHVTSTAYRGEGPGEISNIGYIAIDDANRRFYVSDHGKQKVFSYDLDSVLANSLYMPKEKAKMKGLEFPSEYQYVNDTLSLGIIIKPTGNSGFNQLVANWNMSTGEITPMTYEHPDIENKRVNIAVSIEDKIYVECYSHYDLMTICALNGNLKWNIYGPKWNKEKTKTTHYEGVAFCKNRILASYSGQNSFIEEKGRGKKVNFPTQFIVFDANGNYIQTLETGYQITDFCYDIKNNRILMSLEDEIQFGCLDLDGILK